MTFDVDAGLLTRRDIRTRAECIQFFSDMRRRCPDLWPEKYDSAEPLRHRFTTVDEAAEKWSHYFFWRRRRPTAEGSIFFAEEEEHHALYIRCKASEISLGDLKNFLLELSSRWRPDFGYIYLLSQAEDADPDRTVMPFRRGIVTRDLMNCLPDLPWFTLFGKPYVDLFGKARLLTAPVAQAEEIFGDVLTLQACDLSSSESMAGRFVRSAIDTAIDYLGRDAFCGPGGKKRSPTFAE